MVGSSADDFADSLDCLTKRVSLDGEVSVCSVYLIDFRVGTLVVGLVLPVVNLLAILVGCNRCSIVFD